MPKFPTGKAKHMQDIELQASDLVAVLKLQRNDAMDAVATWRAKALEQSKQIAAMSAQIAQLEAKTPKDVEPGATEPSEPILPPEANAG